MIELDISDPGNRGRDLAFQVIGTWIGSQTLTLRERQEMFGDAFNSAGLTDEDAIPVLMQALIKAAEAGAIAMAQHAARLHGLSTEATLRLDEAELQELAAQGWQLVRESQLRDG